MRGTVCLMSYSHSEWCTFHHPCALPTLSDKVTWLPPLPLLSLERTPYPPARLTLVSGGRCRPAATQRESQDLLCALRCKSFKGHIVTAGEEQLLQGEEEEGGGGLVIEEQSCRRRKLQVLFLRWEFGKSLVGCSWTHTHAQSCIVAPHFCFQLFLSDLLLFFLPPFSFLHLVLIRWVNEQGSHGEFSLQTAKQQHASFSWCHHVFHSFSGCSSSPDKWVEQCYY